MPLPWNIFCEACKGTGNCDECGAISLYPDCCYRAPDPKPSPILTERVSSLNRYFDCIMSKPNGFAILFCAILRGDTVHEEYERAGKICEDIIRSFGQRDMCIFWYFRYSPHAKLVFDTVTGLKNRRLTTVAMCAGQVQQLMVQECDATFPALRPLRSALLDLASDLLFMNDNLTSNLSQVMCVEGGFISFMTNELEEINRDKEDRVDKERLAWARQISDHGWRQMQRHIPKQIYDMGFRPECPLFESCMGLMECIAIEQVTSRAQVLLEFAKLGELVGEQIEHFSPEKTWWDWQIASHLHKQDLREHGFVSDFVLDEDDDDEISRINSVCGSIAIEFSGSDYVAYRAYPFVI